MTWIRAAAMGAAVTFFMAPLAATSDAAPSRGVTRAPIVFECDNQVSAIPLPAAIVSRYLPEGFSPLGPEDQDEIVYVAIGSLACTDDLLEQVQLTFAFTWVKPPKKMERSGAAHIFVLDAIHRGSGSDEFVERLCLGGIVDIGDQTASVGRDIGGTGVSRSSGTAASDALKVRWHMATFGGPGQLSELTRWFFGPKGGTHVDVFEYSSYLGVGESSVVFEQPYREVPPASAVPSYYKQGSFGFRRQPGCS